MRRTHMYLGLFLLPWVLLYGLTGFLFNHGQVLAPYDIHELPSEVGQQIRTTLPPPEVLADTLLARLALELPNQSIRRSETHETAYRQTMGFRTYKDGVRHHLVLESENWTSEIHSAVPKPETKTPLGKLKKLSIGKVLDDSLVVLATCIYQKNGQPADKVDHQWGPQLKMTVAVDGINWALFYNIGNRNIWMHPSEGTEGRKTLRDYLLGLHLAHTYPVHSDIRTVWAVMVDLVSGVMVLWAITGGAMWWQMRNVRRSGAIVIGISLTWAILLGYLMYFAFKQVG